MWVTIANHSLAKGVVVYSCMVNNSLCFSLLATTQDKGSNLMLRLADTLSLAPMYIKSMMHTKTVAITQVYNAYELNAKN